MYCDSMTFDPNEPIVFTYYEPEIAQLIIIILYNYNNTAHKTFSTSRQAAQQFSIKETKILLKKTMKFLMKYTSQPPPQYTVSTRV
jgi:hypothetical protein